MSDSDDTESFDEERYLEADEFTEAPNFVEETRTMTWSPNPIYMQRSKLMSKTIRAITTNVLHASTIRCPHTNNP